MKVDTTSSTASQAASDPAPDLARAALTLARRFAAGATMWCVAPEWPAHARHVAVEFVHPVIVGKRALPAVSLDGPGLVDRVRLSVCAGDVVIVVAGPDDAVAADLLRRAGPWGVTSIWVGAGADPEPGGADHVLWRAAPPGEAAGAADLVLLYHLLWELTHVVFEHPGLLTVESAGSDDVCVTCSDEGRVAEVLAASEPDGRARVLAAGREEAVDATLVAPVARGDLVLVHAGTAIARLGAVTG